jgi:two-component system CheB/CheR fusion protein
MPKARKSRSLKHFAKAPRAAQKDSKKGLPVTPTPEFPIVAVGASAGGLEALTLLVENLTPDLGMAYIIVEHLDPNYKSMLADLLSRKTTVPIEEVKQKTRVQVDHIYVIPPNRNLSLERGELCLTSRVKGPARHMPIDFLFRSVGRECPDNCVGIVLSGTGSDGSLGIDEIKAAGGITFAQDQESAKHDGMPRSAIATGHIDYVMNPESIARELRRIATHPFISGKRIPNLSQETQLQRIFTILRSHTSVDFKHYKQNTVKRRVFRRMALLKIDKLDQYIKVLSENQGELEALYQDLLIKVTSFFREAASFKILGKYAFPVIAKMRTKQEPIRVWVPGCSSGEEVYSLAIALLEYLGDNVGRIPIQIFGTDVSEVALEKARSGIYIENIALDVSPPRLRRWFARIDRGYQISKDIREMCIFAKQNVTSDPPFSKIDLISCRNLLIYLDPYLQGKVMPIFHYALKPTGFLMLGNSESVGAHMELFTVVDKRTKIYTKKMDGLSGAVSFSRKSEEYLERQRTPLAPDVRKSDIQDAADHFIVSRFAPVGVIIDNDFKIIQFRGATGEYLEPAPGRATFHLLKMARGHLGLELRTLIQQARSTGRPVRKEQIAFKAGLKKARKIAIEVAPIRKDRSSDYHFLVLFNEPGLIETADNESLPPTISSRGRQETEITDLRKELSVSSAQLQSTIEEAEATTEELKSANEEVMSSNEELQSTNEELETAKEELQSANEELTTVNDEVQSRNNELTLLNNDLSNFLVSVNVPVIMLGTDLKIRRFTPSTKQVFNLIPTDVGRPFGDIKPKVHVPRLEELIAQVIDSVVVHEQEVIDVEGRFYRLCIRPYFTPEKKIEGAVLVFLDIDSIKRTSLELEESKQYAEAIVEAVSDPLLVLNAKYVIQRANSAYYRLFHTATAQTENRSLFALDKSQWDLPAVRELLRATFKSRRKSESVEITDRFFRVGERSLLLNARPIYRESNKSSLILLTMSDITARRKAEEEKIHLASELERERILLEAVLTQMAIGVAIFEAPSGKLFLANQALHAIFRKKLPGSASVASFNKIRVLFDKRSTDRNVDWPMTRSLKTGEVVPEEEVTLAWSKLDLATLNVSSRPVFNGNKQIIAVVALFQDITERKRINDQIVDVSGREQRRIAHDLHDGLGQELAAVVYRIKALKTHLARAKAPEADQAGKIGILTEAALARTRDLVKAIQPVAIDSRGLMHSLKDLIQSFGRLYGVECSFSCPKPVRIADPDTALHVFRIAQEALQNAIKHGKPKQIRVQLLMRGKLVELKIANDGFTFNPSPARQNNGLGLHIMKHRAAMLRGDLTIERLRPRGTVVKCLFKADAKS